LKHLTPDGWHQKWAFLDEIELWRIDKSHWRAALEYEIGRESGHYLNIYGQIYNVPWLTLDLKEQENLAKSYNANSVMVMYHNEVLGIHELEPSHMPTTEETPLLPFHAHDCAAIDHPLAIYTDQKGRIAIDREELNCVTYGELTTVCLQLSSESTRAELIAGFAEMLDQFNISMKKPKRGKKVGDDFSKLQALAIMRLRHWLSADIFFEPLKGSEYQFWGAAKAPWKIRKMADERRQWFIKKLRKVSKVNALKSEKSLSQRIDI
jgi:hypothetical protein